MGSPHLIPARELGEPKQTPTKKLVRVNAPKKPHCLAGRSLLWRLLGLTLLGSCPSSALPSLGCVAHGQCHNHLVRYALRGPSEDKELLASLGGEA